MPKFNLSAVLIIVGLVGCTSATVDQPEDSMVAGCLQPGTQEEQFVFVADDEQTYQVQPVEGITLAPYVNQRVELTGTLEQADADKVVRTKAVKIVAESCEG